jgi:quercetin dioxygenase-like cupin family protein
MTRVSFLTLATLVSLAAATASDAQASLRRPYPDSLPNAMLVRLDSIEWTPRDPVPGKSQFAIIHVDQKTGATQLYFRVPPRFSLERHWHSANETNVVIRGTFLLQHDGGERVTMRVGDFNFMPGRMIHRAWTADEETILFVSLDGRFDYHSAADSVPMPASTPRSR